MLPLANIAEVISLGAEKSGVPFMREFQTNAKKIKKPFVSYYVLSQSESQDHTEFVKNIFNENKKEIQENSYLLGWALVSVAVNSDDAVFGWQIGQRLFEFYNRHSNRMKMEKELGVYVTNESEQIQDRSTFLENGYEIKHGFDLRIEKYKTETNFINIVENMKAKGAVYGVY